MAQYNELPVYKATYDLLLAIFQFTKEFSKEYKYTVGESLKKETIELLTLIYRVNTRYQKSDVLQMAREQIEVIRLLIRVMKDMKQINLQKFVKINQAARWHCKNLPYPKQVDVSYKRLYWLRMPVRQIKWLLLQPFRVATVTMMEHSTILETTVTGGVLLRAIPIAPGTGTCTTIT